MATTLESLREQIRSDLEAGNLDAAAESCFLGLHQYPRWVEGHRFLGEINLSQDALQEAKNFFELAAAAEPDNATPYVGIGVVQEHMQRFPEAVVAFERALDLDQTDVEVRQELARLYNELQLSRTVQTTRAGLAHQHLRNHMFRQAQGELDSLLSIEPDRLDLMVARARTAWISGQLDIAEQTARDILSVSPDCVIANLIVGEVLARAGKVDLAASFLTSVRELDPEAELTANALRDVVSEGVVIAQGIPTSTLQVEVEDQPRESGRVAPPDASENESLPVPESLNPPQEPVASPVPTEWKPSPSTADQPRVMTFQPGALESLLKDLDEVWPERLDLSEHTSSAPVSSQVIDPETTTELSSVDDEDLPPSFLGDVSEIIREFEDSNDHYDLFADLPVVPTPSGVGQNVVALSRAGATPVPEPWAQTTATKKWTTADDITLSGQHAIIDLTAALDAPFESTPRVIEPYQASEQETPQSSEPASMELGVEGDGRPIWPAPNGHDFQTSRTATNENTGSTPESVIDVATRRDPGDTREPWAMPLDTGSVDFPLSPTEVELAALLNDSGDRSFANEESVIARSPDVPSPELLEVRQANHTISTSETLESASTTFEVGNPDEALHRLSSLVKAAPETAEATLHLLENQSGGSRALRLKVEADCLMATARYWDAMAKYTEALDMVRAHAR